MPAISLRPDVGIWKLFDATRFSPATYIIGHRELDSYIVVPEAKLPAVRLILELMDGRRTTAEIDAELREHHRLAVRSEQLLAQLSNAGLLEGTTAPAGDVTRMCVRLGSIRIAPLLERSRRFPQAAFRLMALAGLVAALAGLWLMMFQGPALIMTLRDAWPRMSRFASAGLVAECAAVILASVFLHEFAHAVTAVRYGLVAQRLHFALYMGFMPIIYLKIPGLYTLPPAQRIAVWIAGVWVNLILGMAGLAGLFFLPQGHREWIDCCSMLAAINYTLVVTNMIPFLPTDGYFILSTVCRVYNIRRDSLRHFRKALSAERTTIHPLAITYLFVTVILLFLALWRDEELLRHAWSGSRWRQAGIAAILIPWVFALARWLRAPSRTSGTSR